MAQLSRKAGFASLMTQVFLKDSTTGLGKTGLTYSGITCYYRRDTSPTSQAVAMSAITTQGTYGVYAPNVMGFAEVDAIHMPGLYEVHIPNQAVTTGAGSVSLLFTASGVIPEPMFIGLEAVDNQSSALFMTSVPIVAGIIQANLVQVGGVAYTPDATAQAGSTSTTIKLAATDTYATGTLVNRKITITGGTGKGQSRYVTANDGGTLLATVDTAWVVTPDTTSTYSLGETAATSSAAGGAPTAAENATATAAAILVTPGNKIATNISGYTTSTNGGGSSITVADILAGLPAFRSQAGVSSPTIGDCLAAAYVLAAGGSSVAGSSPVIFTQLCPNGSTVFKSLTLDSATAPTQRS